MAWFTTMVGKKETLKRVRAMLNALGVPGVRSTQFTQGRTQRWGLAWSFKASQQVARKQPGQALTVPRYESALQQPILSCTEYTRLDPTPAYIAPRHWNANMWNSSRRSAPTGSGNPAYPTDGSVCAS